MRIKIPLIEIETNKDCPCENYKEYEIKVKCIKSKLHCKYLIIIAVMICIWLFAELTYGDDNFISQISFASTITSIILSVLAIIMSITGENKSEVARNQLEETSKKIDLAVESMQKINVNTINNISSVQDSLKLLNKRIEDMDLHIQEYTKEKINTDVTVESNFSNNAKWGKIDEKKMEY